MLTAFFLLCDFVVQNDLFVANFREKQNVRHTYSKDLGKSYIDHVFVSKFFGDHIENYLVVHDSQNNVSNYLPLCTSVTVPQKIKDMSRIKAHTYHSIHGLIGLIVPCVINIQDFYSCCCIKSETYINSLPG